MKTGPIRKTFFLSAEYPPSGEQNPGPEYRKLLSEYCSRINARISEQSFTVGVCGPEHLVDLDLGQSLRQGSEDHPGVNNSFVVTIKYGIHINTLYEY